MEVIEQNSAKAPFHFVIAAITDTWPVGQFPADLYGADLQVTFQVNGHDLLFSAVIEDIYRRMNARVDGEVLAKAKGLISAAGLEPVRQALERVEWEISEALEAVLARGTA